VKPGQLCNVVATFIEDRDGRALVRLPNGSKTSIPYGATVEVPAQGHFVPAEDGSSVSVYCSHSDWSDVAPDFNQAATLLVQHALVHPTP
jgi:hypothetical protein